MPRVHRTEVRVRFGETDQMGVVYHANYIIYFELGRTEMMREHGVDYREMEDHGMSLAVTELGSRFLRSARYDDRLQVETTLVEASGARVHFRYRVLRAGPGGEELLADGFTKLGCVNRDGRPARIQSPWRERLAALVDPS